jgi:hypothetical protein
VHSVAPIGIELPHAKHFFESCAAMDVSDIALSLAPVYRYFTTGSANPF